MIRLLFNSSRQRGRLALDSSDGHTLSSGQRLTVKQGEFWIPGIVESDGESYLLIPDSGSWEARIELRAGMTVQDETTLEANYPASGQKEWWEESPEEFVAGFSEEVHTHHAESEVKPVTINQNSPDAMAALYGPAAAHSEYSRFTRVRYREDGRTKQGLIIWITEASKDSPMLYVIEPAQGGFPEWIAGGDITGVVE